MIRSIVILGGGTAGWMTASALARAFGQRYRITLVEAEAIGTVGVGEATVPPIRAFNQYLGIPDDVFVAETGGSFKLGIAFEGWNGPGSRYFHPFGVLGPDMDGVDFHHFWLRYQSLAGECEFAAISPEATAAAAGVFARSTASGPLNHAFHFDASRYARLLRRYAEERGVVRIDGILSEVVHGADGNVTALRLASGHIVTGDLFIDCSGFRGLLIDAMGVEWEDWSSWLPCDRAVALPSDRADAIAPFTRAIAGEAGWQWRIPLQHRMGNGHVYCSSFLSDDAAEDALRGAIGVDDRSSANRLRFTTGRRRSAWAGNVVAIGLASGFLEPLESTSIHLIQSAVIRLLALFPDTGCDPRLTRRFNDESAREYEAIRDFVIAHYWLSAGHNTPFWSAIRDTPPPDALADRIEVYRLTGTILYDRGDLFGPTNWYAVLTGQGVRSNNFHPLARALPDAMLIERIKTLTARSRTMVAGLPDHEDFITQNCPARPLTDGVSASWSVRP